MDVRRVHLSVVQPDRRLVLRGAAAALVAGLLGCGKGLPSGDDDGGDDGLGPDGGVTNPDAAPVSTGFMQCGSDLCFDLSANANAQLRVVGGQRIVAVGGKRYLVIRTAADAFVALSAICTHEGCTVSFVKARNDVECPCHGSKFTLGGAVTEGPATMPLRSYQTRFDQASETLTVVLA
jgi:cytochrome b6-f complex iron-sulfur subunit